LARDLRRGGVSVEIAEGKLKRILELANKLGARFTLIVGENEIAAGRYALKEMATGRQEEVTRDEIALKLGAARN
jgi:histidyl-tRNA synthetase